MFAMKDEKSPASPLPPKDDKTPSPPPPKNGDDYISPAPPPWKGGGNDMSPSSPAPKDDKDDKDDQDDKDDGEGGGGDGGGGGCSDADPANANACAPSSVPFKCGNTDKIETLPCPSGSVPCRFVPGTNNCDGNVVTVVDGGAEGVRVEAPGALAPGAAAVLVKGGNGYCSYRPDQLPLRPPVNCGGKNQCGLSHMDACYKKGAGGGGDEISPSPSSPAPKDDEDDKDGDDDASPSPSSPAPKDDEDDKDDKDDKDDQDNKDDDISPSPSPSSPAPKDDKEDKDDKDGVDDASPSPSSPAPKDDKEDNKDGDDDDISPSPSPSSPAPKDDKDDKDDNYDEDDGEGGGGGGGGGGSCSDADPANANACAPSSVPFKCGNTPTIETLQCPSGSLPCRIVPGVSNCDGDVVVVKGDGQGDLMIEARGIVSASAPVIVSGGSGYCTFPDATSSPLRPPKNCGGDKKQTCPLLTADVCFCSGKNGALRLVSAGQTAVTVASLAERAALPCEAVVLENLAAVDACGVAVPVVVTISTVADEEFTSVVLATLAPGSTIAAGRLGCGTFNVAFYATHPDHPELVASISYDLTLRDQVLPQAPEASICAKTWKTACSGAAITLVPDVGISGCTIAATFSPQKDVCGVLYPIVNETLNVGSCGANKR